MERARTYIDRSRAYVGNRWLGRSWNLFPGETLGLHDLNAKLDWIAHPVEPVTPGGSVEWSDESNDRHAILMMRRLFDDAAVWVRAAALHEHPALVTQLTRRQTSSSNIEIHRLDSLDLTHPELTWREHTIAIDTEENIWQPAEHCVVATRGANNLILGCETGATVDVEGGVCTWQRVRDARTVMPATFIFAFEGELDSRAETAYRAFVEAMRTKPDREADDEDE